MTNLFNVAHNFAGNAALEIFELRLSLWSAQSQWLCPA
jgi:hypothetical protein